MQSFSGLYSFRKYITAFGFNTRPSIAYSLVLCAGLYPVDNFNLLLVVIYGTDRLSYLLYIQMEFFIFLNHFFVVSVLTSDTFLRMLLNQVYCQTFVIY